MIQFSETGIVPQALTYAYKAHAGQVRKKSNRPYIEHCAMTGLLTKVYGQNDEVQAAAILHDVIEDTDTTYDDIEQEFGEKIANIVWDCTDTPGLRGNLRRADKLRKIAELPNNSPSAIVQLCDLHDNLSEIYMIYRDQGKDTFDMFGAGVGILKYYQEKHTRLATKIDSTDLGNVLLVQASGGVMLSILVKMMNEPWFDEYMNLPDPY